MISIYMLSDNPVSNSILQTSLLHTVATNVPMRLPTHLPGHLYLPTHLPYLLASPPAITHPPAYLTTNQTYPPTYLPTSTYQTYHTHLPYPPTSPPTRLPNYQPNLLAHLHTYQNPSTYLTAKTNNQTQIPTHRPKNGR